jgi:hypothetical protein
MGLLGSKGSGSSALGLTLSGKEKRPEALRLVACCLRLFLE